MKGLRIFKGINAVLIISFLVLFGVNGYTQNHEAPGVELKELRTRDSKTFKDSDDQYRRMQTTGVFHFKNDTGHWEDIQREISRNNETTHEVGIYKSDLPISINLQTGNTKMQLREALYNLEFGQYSRLEYLDKSYRVLSSYPSSQVITSNELGKSSVVLHNYYPKIDRAQLMDYWYLQTDYVINERIEFPENSTHIAFTDFFHLDDNWSINTAEGEWVENAWQGNLSISDENNNMVAVIGLPKFYDSSSRKDNSGKINHATIGRYLFKKIEGGYLISLLVDAGWLKHEDLVYPVIIDPTITNTYANTQNLQDKNTQFNSNCEASMQLSLPAGNPVSVTNTSIQYTIQAKGYIGSVLDWIWYTDYYADGVEQRSRVGVGTNWTPIQNGYGSLNSQPFNVPYNISNSSIANGCYTGGAILTYKWQGYNTFYPYWGGPAAGMISGCTANYQQLLANTWVVTVTYTIPNITATANPVIQTVCAGDNAPIQLTGSPSGVTYTWTATNSGTTGGANGSGASINHVLNTTGQQSGTVTYTITPSHNGCQGNPVTATVNVTPSSTTNVSAQFCTGHPYVFNGNSYSNGGIYNITLQSSLGCDSIIVLNLQQTQVLTQTINEFICPGQSYPLGQNTYSTSGIYTATFNSSLGCDSIVTLNLNVYPEYNLSVNASICQGTSYLFNGNSYSTAGSYTANLQTINGCDSTVTLNLSINPPLTGARNESICQGAVYNFHGTNYSTSGVYTTTVQTAGGCDSIVTLNLTVNNPLISSVAAQICQGSGFSFQGSNYSVAGNYPVTLQTAAGCDSIVTLNLTVNPPLTSSMSAQICQGSSYLFHGNNYTTSGVYTATLQSTVGCDSIVTLNLTVNPALSSNTYAQICSGNNYNFHGATYNTSGVYTTTLQTAAGCDSLVILNLTVTNALTSAIDRQICQGESYTFNNSVYSNSGNYHAALLTSQGCDSIATLNLTVNPNYQIYTNESVCAGMSFSFNGNNYSTAGSYQALLTSSKGCDSIVNLNLSIQALPLVDIGNEYSLCTGQSVSIENNGSMGNYLWSTGSIENRITVANSGRYWLKLTSPAGCIAYDTCNVVTKPSPVKPDSMYFELCGGELRYLNAGNPGATYLWNNSSTNQILTVSKGGEYEVLISNQFGCARLESFLVREFCEPSIYIPSAFTPDNDGLNDYFIVDGESIGSFEMTVFNRWGQPVFETNDVGQGWDGSVDSGSHYAQDGLYHWVIRYRTMLDVSGIQSDWKELKGYVTIVR